MGHPKRPPDTPHLTRHKISDCWQEPAWLRVTSGTFHRLERGAVQRFAASSGSCAVNGSAEAATVLNRGQPTRFGKSAVTEARIGTLARACNSFHDAPKDVRFNFV